MVRIINDVFDIAWRIKSIDSRYELFYNRKMKRYEVHINGVLQSVIPYKTLDARSESYLRYTRKENVKRLLSDIEKSNDLLEISNKNRILKRAEYDLEEALR